MELKSLKENLKLNKKEWLLALTGTYCVVAVMMNILCVKPLNFGTSFTLMDGGLLVSWLVFLIANVITEVYGKRTAQLVAGVATLVALFVSIVAALEVYIPTLPEYAEQNEHFKFIFNNGPRTIVSSAIAFYIGNIVNVGIIAKLKNVSVKNGRDNSYRFAARAVLSTIIGQFVDNALFDILAFAPIGLSAFEMQWKDIATIVLVGTPIETAIEAFFVPLITIPLTRFLQKKSDDESVGTELQQSEK
ncbi:MAG: queuosine precursor transporter [Bacteroidales bacterium]|nr:queuosine precursor transporter [Bacteroidales bacterium]